MSRVCLALTLCAVVGCDAELTPGGGDAAAGGSAGAGAGGSAGASAGAGAGASAGAGARAGAGGSAGAGGGAGRGGAGGNAAGSGGAGRAGGGGTGGAGRGGSSGGAPDAGAPDAGEPPAVGCDGSYLLCEDFEDTDVGAIPSGWEMHGDPVGVADDEAASGSRALKIGPRDNGERRIYHDAAALPSTHWGRVRFKVQLPVPDAFVHSTLVAFTGRSPKPDMANLEVRVVDTVKESIQGFNNDGNGSHFQVLYNVQPQSRDEFGTGSSYDWKFDDAWHCAEWYLDSAQQAYRFFLDGDEIEDIAFMHGAGQYDDSEIPTSFDELRVGWNNYQAAPPGFTAWLDDFALDDQRIPCD